MRKLSPALAGGEVVLVNQALKTITVKQPGWLRQLKELTFTVKDNAASPLANLKLSGRSSPILASRGAMQHVSRKRDQCRMIKCRGKTWKVLPCLNCGKSFRSVGPGNRLCARCRARAHYISVSVMSQ